MGITLCTPRATVFTCLPACAHVIDGHNTITVLTAMAETLKGVDMTQFDSLIE